MNDEISDEKVLTVLVAALFRAAKIISGDQHGSPNTEAIESAQQFVRSCKQHGLLPPS